MRRLRELACGAVIAAAAGRVGWAAPATATAQNQTPAAPAKAAPPPGAAPAKGNAVESLQVQGARLLRLSRLQHAAEREIQLAMMGQAAASRPETRRYAADLETDFRRLNGRIAQTAGSMNIDTERLRRIFAGENTAALRREAEDLDRLSKARGPAFDQQFWVVVTHEQMAAADMLGTLAGDDPSINPLVADMALLLERATGNAVVAAKAVTGPGPVVPAGSTSAAPPAKATPAPTEAPAEEEAAPTEGPPAADTPSKP